MAHPGRLNLQSLGDTAIMPPGGDPWHVELKDPARSAMTDFNERGMVTVEGSFAVDKALEIMKHAGVRAAFVVSGSEHEIVGLITAYDILGEKPLRHMQAMGCTHNTCSRDDVLVQDIMERTKDWRVLSFPEVESAPVRSVIDLLHASGRTHLPVVERRDGGECRLRGIFSSAKLMRLTSFSRQAA